ncbi:MAG TPA: DNA topoisomerase (ATP-hydrolyzing) [Desulfomonilaceae bacterium]|nr:DNA topoisomerase (ATP-hydrolyzing) [Desulfomonilaceae bacterium]
MSVQHSRSGQESAESEAVLRHEVEKRYLAYALSTIVSRALPDVRDGLKPVHRRILYAMQGLRLTDTAKMRKSAAVVGEVIGKYHPHGDQAAYDALVRMAQDFSLRYPLIEGSGNFGSLDGDSPAAMRYTETRLSALAGLLLRDIDQGTTDFHPTYDATGEEPDVLPSAVPNLLINGSSGIAVGMSCSFPPHNLREVLTACRAAIRDENIDTNGLLKYIKGPDFPTGGEIIEDPQHLADVYTTGHGFVRIRATFDVEEAGRGKTNLIVTSIPYSVNKSRLIERIAQLIRDKKLRHVYDVRDESTQDVRIVLELRGADVSADSIMAFLYKHTDLQINFPVNHIAITPLGTPERLRLDRIIRYFLDFRYEKTVLKLKHRLEILHKRIHVLEGFRRLFDDLDAALRIIRSAGNRKQAEQELKTAFALDAEQVDAILEMRLYKLVALEIGKVLDELAAKTTEAEKISRDVASEDRLWKIVDEELAEIAVKFGDERRTRILEQKEATAQAYDPDEFVEHGDVTVILSRQGWIRRIKTEVDDPATVKLREGDSLLGCVRVNTGSSVAVFSNLGKVYVIRALEVPASVGFGEPISSIFTLVDGEFAVGFMAPDRLAPVAVDERGTSEGADGPTGFNGEDSPQYSLFAQPEQIRELPPDDQLSPPSPDKGILITRRGKGFRFDSGILREPTKRSGRKLMSLAEGDEVVDVRPEDGELVVIGVDSGRILVFPVEHIPVLAGPGQGVRMIKVSPESGVVCLEVVGDRHKLLIHSKEGVEQLIEVADIQRASRGTRGKSISASISRIERISGGEGHLA